MFNFLSFLMSLLHYCETCLELLETTKIRFQQNLNLSLQPFILKASRLIHKQNIGYCYMMKTCVYIRAGFTKRGMGQEGCFSSLSSGKYASLPSHIHIFFSPYLLKNALKGGGAPQTDGIAWCSQLHPCQSPPSDTPRLWDSIQTSTTGTKAAELTIGVNPQATNVIYIYMEHPFLMFLDHTRRRSTVGRTPLDE